jgi:hypothetical protein
MVIRKAKETVMGLRAYKLFSVAVLSVIGLLITVLLVSTATAKSQATLPEGVIATKSGSRPEGSRCLDALPTIQWLGQGIGTYVLEDGYQVFIVKRLPFTFVLEQGEQNDNGQFVYQASTKERVWACAGNCQLPAVYHAEYAIGTFDAGTTLNLVVIDDDQDERRNWWAANDPAVPYQVVDDQQMVEYLSFTVPFTATWYYYAADSIGVAATCVEATTLTPTQTPTNTLAPPTNTPTNTPTPTDTLVPATHTPSATPTETATPTATPIPPLPPEPPTALDPTEEPRLSSPSFVYLPLMMN